MVTDRLERTPERLIAFSDGVFAIAITLLVIDLRPPDGAADLGAALAAMWPKYVGFALSFWVIYLYWRAHHTMFRYIRLVDDGLVRLNTLLLFCVVVVPFPTSVLGEYGDRAVAVTLYDLTMAATSLASTAVWVYATRHPRLLVPGVTRETVARSTARALAPAVVFALGALAAQVEASLGLYVLPLIWAAQPVAERWAARR